MKRKKFISKSWEGWVFILPALFLFSVFVLYPIIRVIFYSFMNWDGMGTPTFTGLENYKNIFTSPEFKTSILNNLKFLIVGVPVWTFFPLVVAVFLHEEVKGWKFFRSAYFFPSIISTAVISTLFRFFFLYNGPVNSILAIFGLQPINWFAHGNLAIGLIIFIINWVGFGSAVMIYLAGMANISEEIYEAAELDGANWWEKLTKLTMPMLNTTIQFVVMLNVMTAFAGIFGYVFMMTSGGPGYDTTVVEYLLYVKAFTLHDFGYASALSVILFLIVTLITVIQNYITKEKDDEEGGLL
jgi:multiple sugar transport system permease protein